MEFIFIGQGFPQQANLTILHIYIYSSFYQVLIFFVIFMNVPEFQDILCHFLPSLISFVSFYCDLN